MAAPYDEMPGPRQLPLVGNGYELWRAPASFPVECIREYGDMVRLRIPGYDAVLVGHPDQVGEVLDSSGESYGKGTFYREQLGIFESGLLVSEGELWRKQREILGSLFRPGDVETHLQTMIERTQRTMDGWESGAPVRMETEMQRLALGVIAEALCSVDLQADVPRMREAIGAVMDYRRHERRIPFELPTWLPTPQRRRYHNAIETFDDIVADIIADHRNDPDPPADLVTTLLQARAAGADHVTTDQIRDEILTFLLAGHDTTALAAAFMWQLLGSHTPVQEQARQEVQTALDGDEVADLDFSDLSHCRRIIDETLRLFPPVYHFARATETAVTLGGYRIPPETVVLLHPWTYHRDPRWYDSPGAFQPGRWVDEPPSERGQAFMPFGAGPRRCIGERFARLELLVILVTGLRRYRIAAETPGDPELAPSLSLRPAEHIAVTPHALTE